MTADNDDSSQPLSPDLWAWVVTDHDGREGPLGVVIPAFGLEPIPAVTMTPHLARELFRPLAEEHARRTQRPVRLVRYQAVDLEVQL